MQQINANDEHVSTPVKPSRNEKIFLVIVTIGFLFPTIVGFIFYALPKFAISKFLLKKQSAKGKIVRDTAISGLILGSLVLLGQSEILPSTIDGASTQSQQSENIVTDTKENKITKNDSDEEIVDNLYRNTKYDFEIKFPVGWKLERGDGVHVLIKASDNRGDSMNIAVNDMENNIDTSSVTSIEDMGSIEDFKNELLKGSLGGQMPNYKIVEYNKTTIDKHTAYFFRSTHSSIDGSTFQLNQYSVLNGSKMYTISAGSAKNNYENLKPFFDESIATFVFESL